MSTTGQRTMQEGGIWAVERGGIVCRELFDVGPMVLLVPSEQVLMLVVDLPLPSPRQRLAALPFAVEDHIAEPLEAVHVALGAEVAPQRNLAGVVRHVLMRDWLALAEAEGLGRCAVVPDALVLPPPDPGGWSIALADGRVLVREDSGRGFALPVALLPMAWEAAGRPPLVSYGEPVPAEVPALVAEAEPMPISQRMRPPPLDLRQGTYAAAAPPLSTALRRLAVVLAAGMLAHGAIGVADMLALRAIAADRHAAAEALALQLAPALADTGDAAAAAERLLQGDRNSTGGMLPLLARSADALLPIAGALSVRSLDYAAGDGALTMHVEAADLAELQRVETALAAAGLEATTGGALIEDGSANGRIVVRDPVGGAS